MVPPYSSPSAVVGGHLERGVGHWSLVIGPLEINERYRTNVRLTRGVRRRSGAVRRRADGGRGPAAGWCQLHGGGRQSDSVNDMTLTGGRQSDGGLMTT